jgi:uncharacterized protein
MGKKHKLKIILDCNWYISAFINRKSRRTVFSLINNPKLSLIYSDELLAEYNTVISRVKFQVIITKSQANRFISFLKPRLLKVISLKMVDASRDKKDNYLLALSKASKADYLITGDKDLLMLKVFRGTGIVKMSEFLDSVLKSEN